MNESNLIEQLNKKMSADLQAAASLFMLNVKRLTDSLKLLTDVFTTSAMKAREAVARQGNTSPAPQGQPLPFAQEVPEGERLSYAPPSVNLDQTTITQALPAPEEEKKGQQTEPYRMLPLGVDSLSSDAYRLKEEKPSPAQPPSMTAGQSLQTIAGEILAVLKKMLEVAVGTASGQAKPSPAQLQTEPREYKERDASAPLKASAMSGATAALPGLGSLMSIMAPVQKYQAAVKQADEIHTENVRKHAAAYKDVDKAVQSGAITEKEGVNRKKVLDKSKPTAPSSVDTGAAMLGGVAGAASAVVDALKGLAAASMAYVEAFSPATIMLFNQVTRDMTAVLGMALKPVIETATFVVKEFADRLYPVMEKLQPVIQMLADAFMEVLPIIGGAFTALADALMPLAKLYGDVMQALTGFYEAIFALVEALIAGLKPAIDLTVGLFRLMMPFIQVVGTAFGVLADIMRVGAAVFSAVWEAITSAISAFFGDTSIKDALGDFRSTIRRLIEGFVLIIATIGRLFGANSFVENLAKNLRKADGGDGAKKDSTGLAAAQDAKYSSFSEFGKTIALSASIASGTATPQKKSEEWLSDIASKIDKLDTQSMWDMLKMTIKQALMDIVNPSGFMGPGSALTALANPAQAGMSFLKFLSNR